MTQDTEKIRLILGLKVRQLRLERGLSQHELAQRVGVAHSYLNEIEKGKKYPKGDKMLALAQALDTDYDTLVSLKLEKKLEPITELLNSRVLSDLPLAMFGMEAADFLQLMSEAPAKLSAFVNTIIELTRSYDLRLEQFYFAVLRTYQELHDNSFPDLETAAEAFLGRHLHGRRPDSAAQLKSLLAQVHGYRFQTFNARSHPAIGALRSVFVPAGRVLWLNEQLTGQQLLFTLARECGYAFLGVSQRPLESSVVEPASFEHMLNNFRASYFARAVLLPRHELAPQAEAFLARPQWSGEALLHLLEPFAATPELFLLRLTNVLVQQLGLHKLFFLRLDHRAGSGCFTVAKELRLARGHSLPGPVLHEHYCRRWVSVTALQELAGQVQAGTWDGRPLVRTQRWRYLDGGAEFWVVTLAKPSPPRPGALSSVSLGIEVDEAARGRLAFLNDPHIAHRDVGETCERCPAADCAERAAPPLVLQRGRQVAELKQAVAALGGG